MKKFFALTLAVAMVLSLAAVSMAAVQVAPKTTNGADAANVLANAFYTYNKDDDLWKAVENANSTGTVPYGKTVYLPIQEKGATASCYQNGHNMTGAVTTADAVKGLKVSAKWSQNADFVKSVEIVKVDNIYAVAIATTGSSTGTTEILGELTIKGKSYFDKLNNKNELETDKTSVEQTVNVEIDLAYGKYNNGDPVTAGPVDLTDGQKLVINFKDLDDEDFEMNFGDKISVETYMKNTEKVLFGYNEDENDDILDEYVDANLDFYNCTGTFRRTATVVLEAEEDTYLYEVVDGKVVAMDAEYDEWEGAFIFKTKKMGNYVVSDMKLEATAAVETAPANPSTGAAA